MKTIIRSTAVRSLFAAPEPQPPRDLMDPLVRRAAQGDRNAIGALARTFRPQLFATAIKHLDNDGDAEDVVQDLFVLLLEGKLDAPRARESALGWLLRAVATLAEEQNDRERRRR
jgi:DNA-directed RNA polymerase specialized sigma24 family protein